LGNGGGIANYGTATLSDVTISGNSSAGSNGGGGIYTTGPLTLTRVSVTGNTITGTGYAGGLYLAAQSSLSDVNVSNNTGNQVGGILVNYSGSPTTLSRVLVSNNQPLLAATLAGGMYVTGGSSADLINATFSGNQEGPSASSSAAAGTQLASAGTASLTNVTFYGVPSSQLKSVHAASGGTITMTNTLLANGGAAGNCAGVGTITSAGNNLSSDNTCSSFSSGSGDQTNTDPLLGSLANNGGFTSTHALLAGSPAINAGTNTGCPSTDQRGTTRLRVTTDPCDIGGYEATNRTALLLDGTDDYVDGTAIGLAASSFTLEAWARRGSTDTGDIIFAQGTNLDYAGLHVGFLTSNLFHFGFYNDDFATVATYTDTDWHHWAVTYDFASGARAIYRDGVLVASNSATHAYSGTGSLRLGGQPWDPAVQFHGTLDEVRVWTTVRSAGDIAANYSKRLTGAESGLATYWRFDEGTGTSAQDASSGGHTGTLVNGPTWTTASAPLVP
jgi:hypothetical protein